ncbi:DUF6918 family protein [Vulgatibacter sp.]|uniref:DUF6918 family protein n=1 Tax=Vulgatibacter sp. TaxID=1971226 RepID=UPI00356A24B2
MGKLVERLAAPENRRAVVQDGVRLVQAEVEKKGGLSGLALKGAFAVIQKVKSDFVPHVLDKLIPAFAEKLEPFYEEREREAPGQPMEKFLSTRAPAVANALLTITDGRIAKAEKGPVKATYEKLRPAAQRNVEDAVPGIGRLVDKHVG